MSLNIKNERVHALAREAARRTGKSQTSVIEEALTRLLEETLPTPDPEQRLSAVQEIVADFEQRLSDEDRALLSTDSLYDGRGLPA